MTALRATIPALPVRDAAGAVEFYAELRPRDVLHRVSMDAVEQTEFGTPEFAALDADGNLITFLENV